MFKKLLFALLTALILVGCEDIERIRFETAEHCVDAEDRRALAQFIIECSKAANPLSDEEGEDLVSQCERTGERAICPTHEHRLTFIGSSGFRRVEEVDPTVIK